LVVTDFFNVNVGDVWFSSNQRSVAVSSLRAKEEEKKCKNVACIEEKEKNE
jgi:hypothetical protein